MLVVLRVHTFVASCCLAIWNWVTRTALYVHVCVCVVVVCCFV